MPVDARGAPVRVCVGGGRPEPWWAQNPSSGTQEPNPLYDALLCQGAMGGGRPTAYRVGIRRAFTFAVVDADNGGSNEEVPCPT